MAPRSSSRKSRFEYKPPSEKALKERAEQTGGRFDSAFKEGTDMYRMKGGDNAFRILPPTWDDHEHYCFDVWVHSYVGPDNSTYICLNKMKNKPCPICEAAMEAKQAGEDDDAKQMAVSRRCVCWIIDRDGDEDPPIPKVFSMSWTQDRDIAALCTNKRTGKIIFVDHPHEGYDISMKRSGTGLKTKYYGVAIDRDPTPILDDDRDMEKILEFIEENPIPSMLHYYSYDYLKKMISGTAEKKDEDLDDNDAGDDDRPHDRKSRSRRDDDGDDGDEDRKSSRSSRRRDDDDDNGDDEGSGEDTGRRQVHRASSRDDDDNGDDEPQDRGKSGKRSSRRDDDDEQASERRQVRRASSKGDQDELPFDEDDSANDNKSRGRRSSRDDDDNGDDDAPSARRGKSTQSKRRR